MKKLMIAAAIVCAAALSQAATSNWRWTAANIFDGTGSSAADHKYSGTAYIFDMAKVTMETVFANCATDGWLASNSLDSKAVSSGSISASSSDIDFAYGDLATYNFYMAIFDGDKIYFSNVKSATGTAMEGSTPIGFANQNATTSATAPTFSSLAPTGSGFAGAGKWSAVPEPTSGLLLLLGVAGLALRRRRA